MRIIPSIDIIDGKCVRLAKGDYSKQTIYHENPLEVAKRFNDSGLQRLHIVDLDGAKSGSIKNLKVLENISSHTGLQIDFGGGIKTINDVNNVFNAGAFMITIGSLAIKNPSLVEEWIMEFGADKILIGADVLNEKIKISGWLEETDTTIFEFIGNMIALGAHNIFCTDISKDGTMEGPSIDLYKRIIATFPEINFIASGGITSIEDVIALKLIGCKGAIIGKGIYEEKMALPQLAIINSQR